MFVFASNYLSVSNFVHKGSVAFFSFLSVMSSIGDKIVTKIHWLVMYYMYYIYILLYIIYIIYPSEHIPNMFKVKDLV